MDKEYEDLKESLNIVKGDDEQLRSALKVAGFKESDIQHIPEGTLDDLKELVDSGQAACCYAILQQIPELGSTTRIQLLMGLKKITPSAAMKKEDRKQNFWYYVPFVNVIYEVFFDSPPDNEMIKEILNLFGIMGALLFSLVVSIYIGMDPEKIETMKKAWDDDGDYNMCMGYDGNYLVDRFALNMSMSQNLSFLSFVMIMIVYMLFCTTEFEVDTDKASWWFWIKYVVFGCFLLIVFSVLLLFAGLQNFTLLTYPNAYAAEHCADEGKAMLWNTSNLWGSSQLYTFLCMALIGAPMLAMLSYGVTCKAQTRDKRNRVLDDMADSDEMERQSRKSLGKNQGQGQGQGQGQRQGLEDFYRGDAQRGSINPMQVSLAQQPGVGSRSSLGGGGRI